MMRKWQGIILIVLAILAGTAASNASGVTVHKDKTAPPIQDEGVWMIDGTS